jgi:hypothetical protein
MSWFSLPQYQWFLERQQPSPALDMPCQRYMHSGIRRSLARLLCWWFTKIVKGIQGFLTDSLGPALGQQQLWPSAEQSLRMRLTITVCQQRVKILLTVTQADGEVRHKPFPRLGHTKLWGSLAHLTQTWGPQVHFSLSTQGCSAVLNQGQLELSRQLVWFFYHSVNKRKVIWTKRTDRWRDMLLSSSHNIFILVSEILHLLTFRFLWKSGRKKSSDFIPCLRPRFSFQALSIPKALSIIVTINLYVGIWNTAWIRPQWKGDWCIGYSVLQESWRVTPTEGGHRNWGQLHTSALWFSTCTLQERGTELNHFQFCCPHPVQKWYAWCIIRIFEIATMYPQNNNKKPMILFTHPNTKVDMINSRKHSSAYGSGLQSRLSNFYLSEGSPSSSVGHIFSK